MGPLDDTRLTPADESQMAISEMAVILMSLGVAPANFKVAESIGRSRFGDAADDIGFERSFVVDYATGWNMDNEEQMMEVEQHVESQFCYWFSGTLGLQIELSWTTGNLSEDKNRNLVERCVKHLNFCFRMYETPRNAGRLFLHEHP